ncbi:MAG: hypothetical protein M3353_02325, partial [Actinomycetota bacterium]|nr:hypothetical protein [Actinomycetota bacterium]
MLDLDRPDADEFAQRTVDGVDGLLCNRVARGGAAGHPGAGAVAVAEKDGVQAEGAVADVGVEDPLGNHGEPVLEHQSSAEGRRRTTRRDTVTMCRRVTARKRGPEQCLSN